MTTTIEVLDEARQLTEEEQKELLEELEAIAAGEKCEHGVRIAKGDSFARYCSGCNPQSSRILAPRKHVPEVRHEERELDAAEFVDLPVGERIARGGAFHEMYA